MKKRSWVIALALIVVLVTPAFATTASEGAEALAEYMCEDLGGVKTHSWEDMGDGEYGVYAECWDGGEMGGDFFCPMCEPV